MKKKISALISAVTLTVSAALSGMPVNALIYNYEPETEYSYIVHLMFDGKPLAEYDYAVENGVNEFVFTDDGKNAFEELIAEHNSKIKAIENLLGHDVDRMYDYTAVIDGAAINDLSYEEYKKIDDNKDSLGIKSTMYFTFNEETSSKSVKSDNTEYTYKDITEKIRERTGIEESGMKGDSTVIAVIDNEFDAEHEFLKNMPENVNGRIDSEYIKKIAPYLSAYGKDMSGCYVNEKIPFCYNYDTLSTDTSMPDNAEDGWHGTHVAGIAAGNGEAETSEKFEPKGTAPNAQLVLMATYSYSNIYAAMDDCAYLGADVINASYGMGFCNYNRDLLESSSIENLKKLGILFCCAAGNSEKAYFDYGSLLNTDYSSGGTPNGNPEAFTVASADNMVYEQRIISAGGENFAAGGADNSLFDAFPDKELEYVMIPGLGYADDFEGIDAEGRIAVINRGVIMFDEKAQNAMDNGAAGVVFINNTDELITSVACMVLPAAIVDIEAGEILEELEDKRLTVRKDSFIMANEKNNAAEMSSFDITEVLGLKPDITAYGGNILSSVPGDNSYGYASGTSMASPQTAGISALLKEFLKENKEKYGIHSPEDYTDIIARLLMSTARPINDSDGFYIASPRVQGSGLVNLANAMKTPVYLYTDSEIDCGRPKLSLGDDLDKNIGKEEFSSDKFYFHMKNISDKTLTYGLSYDIMRDDATEDDELAWSSSPLKDSRVIFKISGEETDSVTIAPGEDVIINLDIEISEDEKSFISENFVNGTFIDGFVHLKSADEPDLVLPFSGYYGSWSAPEIFSGFVYAGNMSDRASFLSDRHFNPAGANIIAILSDGEYKIADKLPAFSPNGDGAMDNINACLLFNRRCYNVKCEILKDSDVVYTKTWESGAYEQQLEFFDSFLKWDFEGAENGGIYTMKFSAETPEVNSGKRVEEIYQDFIIDTAAPEIKECRTLSHDGGTDILLRVSDNYAIQGGVVSAGDPESEDYFEDMAYSNEMDSKDVYLSIALPDDTKDCNIEIYDMAGNVTTKSADELLKESKGEYNMSYGLFFASDDKSYGDNIKVTDENGKEIPLTFSSTPGEDYESGNGYADVYMDSCEFINMPVFIGLRGDADMNGEVNLYDAIMIAKYLIWDPDSSTDEYMYEFEGSMGEYLADCNKNGKVDLYDAIWIAKAMLNSKKI